MHVRKLSQIHKIRRWYNENWSCLHSKRSTERNTKQTLYGTSGRSKENKKIFKNVKYKSTN